MLAKLDTRKNQWLKFVTSYKYPICVTNENSIEYLFSIIPD